jgi:hypothetical protein
MHHDIYVNLSVWIRFHEILGHAIAFCLGVLYFGKVLIMKLYYTHKHIRGINSDKENGKFAISQVVDVHSSMPFAWFFIVFDHCFMST